MFNDYFLVLGEYVALKGRLVPMDTPGPNTYIYQVTGTLPITVEVWMIFFLLIVVKTGCRIYDVMWEIINIGSSTVIAQWILFYAVLFLWDVESLIFVQVHFIQ